MKKHLGLVAFLFCFAVFVIGLAQLFKLRFEGGDVYPEYSSLRADPLGSMALYEALGRMPGVTVERDFSANNHLPEGKGSSYLQLGGKTYDWQSLSDTEFQILESFVNGGGRLAIACFPERSQTARHPRMDEGTATTPKKKNSKGVGDGKDMKKPKGKEGEALKLVPPHDYLKQKWGIQFGFLALEPGTNHYDSASVENQTSLPFPADLEWHSGTIIKGLSTNWQTIYSRGTNPVVVERKLGAGTVALATDSYFLSNEALRKDRHPELLAWWVGPSQRMVFDEAHFGIVETEGVSTLLKKYHLYGLVGALGLLAALFIWKNALSFVPIPAAPESAHFLPGRDASSGFVNLLRRNIPARDLPQVCFDEWKKSLGKGARHLAARQANAEAALVAEARRPSRERNPLKVYQEICHHLKKV